jgi:hypothetical protein
MIVLGVFAVAACATSNPAVSAFDDPAAFEGQTVRLCGDLRNGGLHSSRTDEGLQIDGAAEDFYSVANWGRKCLTGIVNRTGYDPADTDLICLDYCRVWALDVRATPPQR